MRAVVTAFVAVLVLSAAMVVSAQTSQSKSAVKPAPAVAKHVASHSTAGTVKSIDDNTLVVAHGKKSMTFTVNSSTQKEGTLSVGSHVTVRYTMDGKTMVATAITGQPEKAMAAKSAPAKPAAHK